MYVWDAKLNTICHGNTGAGEILKYALKVLKVESPITERCFGVYEEGGDGRTDVFNVFIENGYVVTIDDVMCLWLLI